MQSKQKFSKYELIRIIVIKIKNCDDQFYYIELNK